MNFENLNLPSDIETQLKKAGLDEVLGLQSHGAPFMTQSHDGVIVCRHDNARTLTCVMAYLKAHSTRRSRAGVIHGIVMVPDEFRAKKAETLFSKMAPGLTIYNVSEKGALKKALPQLRKGADIILLTPAQLYILMEGRNVLLHSAKLLIIDDLSPMLKEGYGRVLEKSHAFLSTKTQKIIVAPEWTDELEHYVGKLIPDAHRLTIQATSTENDTKVVTKDDSAKSLSKDVKPVPQESKPEPKKVSQISRLPSQKPQTKHTYLIVDSKTKKKDFCDILIKEKIDRALILSPTKDEISSLATTFRGKRLPARLTHEQTPVAKQKKNLSDFNKKNIGFLLAAAGVNLGDLKDVQTVIFYALPETADDYQQALQHIQDQGCVMTVLQSDQKQAYDALLKEVGVPSDSFLKDKAKGPEVHPPKNVSSLEKKRYKREKTVPRVGPEEVEGFGENTPKFFTISLENLYKKA